MLTLSPAHPLAARLRALREAVDQGKPSMDTFRLAYVRHCDHGCTLVAMRPDGSLVICNGHESWPDSALDDIRHGIMRLVELRAESGHDTRWGVDGTLCTFEAV